MSYSKRKPPVELFVSIEVFNKLNEFLTTIVNNSNENSDIADKLKNKLLRYSIPILDEDKEKVIIRLFNKEAENLLTMLIYNSIKDYKVETNYYDVLLKIRELQKEKSN